MVGTSENISDHVVMNSVMETLLDNSHPHLQRTDDQDPVQHGDGGDDGKDDKEEPEKHKDLLIDDVKSKDAHAVMFGDGSRGSIHVERTLCNLEIETLVFDFDSFALQVLARNIKCTCLKSEKRFNNFEFFTLGKTTFMGSALVPGSAVVMLITSRP